MPPIDSISAGGPDEPTALLARVEMDPYVILDDLMSVIEAFSPSWPPRGIFRNLDACLL